MWEALHPLSAESADNARVSKRGIAGEGRPVSFAADTMEKTGESDRRTREHLARAAAQGQQHGLDAADAFIVEGRHVLQRVQRVSVAWNAYAEGRDLRIIKCVDGAVIRFAGTPKGGR